MATPNTEVLLTKRGQPSAVRVLLRMNAIVYRYPDYGVWCYLFRSSRGIVVFDPGPRFLAPLGGRGIFGRKSGNTERILAALDAYFPGEPVLYIAASHYHFDHVENAPDLQVALRKRQGTLPPIRLHKAEYGEGKRLLHIFPTSLTRVFYKSGYRSFRLGTPIRDGEFIPGTSFRFIHTPGHTRGNIAIISDKEKLFVGGYWAVRHADLARIVAGLTRLADEYPEGFARTRQRLPQGDDYRMYTYHPVRRPLRLFALRRA